MSGFTPGPWVVGQSENHTACVDAVDPADGKLFELCEVFGENHYRTITETSIANATLIAAAPELLDALDSLKCELILSDVDMDYIESHFRPWLDKAAAAIAKARGTA